jgi:branched-subunit amino acid ABC-type transport system permease component
MEFSALVLQFALGIASGMLTFLLAAGMSLVMSGMNILDFARGAFFFLGAYMCYTLTHVLNFWWAILIGPVVVAAVGGLVELLLRFLYSKALLYQLLLTMGVSLAMTSIMQAIWGTFPKLVPPPALLNSTVPFLGSDFPVYYIFVIIISGIFALGLWLMFEKTKLGMTFRAIISDRDMVSNLGINVSLLFSIMFMFSVWLSGIAGALMAPIIGIQARNAFSILFTVIVVLVIGGLTSMRGALFSALLVGLANAIGALFFPQFYTFIPVTIMIIVVLVKPSGLFVKN